MGLLLDASTDKLTTPAFAIPTGALTYAAWIKNPQFANGGPRIFENTDVNTSTRFFYSSGGDLILQRLYTTTAQYEASHAAMDSANGSEVDWSEWNHVAVTHNGTRTTAPTFYINGNSITGSITSAGSGDTHSSQSNVMTIGNRPANDRQADGLDHVGIYNAVLSGANIAYLLDNPHYGSNQFGNWSFDSLAASYTDLSGNGRTATVGGSPTFIAGPDFSSPIGFPIDVTASLTAQPVLAFLLNGALDGTIGLAMGIESGTPYPGGPGAGVGGVSKGRRIAVLSRRVLSR